MTDTPGNTAVDLGMAAPSPAAPIQEMSFAEATSRKAELMADPKWRDAYYNGEPTARAQMDAIIRGLTPKQPPPEDPASADQAIDWLRERADISDAVADQIRQNMPVTPQERRMTQQLKDRLFADKEWVKRYLDGGRKEQTEMTLINVNLSAPVRGA